MALPFHAEQPVGASPATVWAYLLDLDRIEEWMADTVSLERLTPGPLALGARFRQTRRMYGRVATEEFAVVALDQDARRLDLEVDGRKGSAGRGVFRFRYQVREARGGSLLVLDGEIAELGRALELLAGLFVRNFVRVIERDLDRLRACVEARARASVTTSSTSRAPST